MCNGLLKVEGEIVLVAADEVVQIAAHGEEKLLRCLGFSSKVVSEVGFARRDVSRLDVRKLRDPAGCLQISQAAGTVFDVGLEVVNGVAEGL